MKRRNNNYYHIKYYNDYKYNNNVKKLKIIIIFFIVLITTILIIISKSIEDAQKTAQIEHQKAMQEELLEQERAKAEELKKQEEEAARLAKLPKLTEVGKENMANIYHSDTKRAFLTFDDGPSTVTPQILDTLKQEGVKATFFMLGTSIENFPETTKRVYDEGHYIANHGYSHIYSSIYSSPEEVLNEFNMCNDAVKKALGEPEYNSHLFRFPGGMPGGPYADIKKQAKEILEQHDILSVDWNALTGDAETSHPVAEKLMEELQQTTEGKSSVVILMHDAQAKQVTADMLPQIIAYLREQGYEFQTFYDIIK